jgi:hypothetical protein
MLRLIAPLFAVLFLLLPCLCPAANDEEGFTNLFPADGEPRGWVVREWNDVSRPVDNSPWAIKDGILHSGQRRGTWLMSEKEYTDFILEFEIKLNEVGNSGVALGAPMKGDPAFDGMELQVADFRYKHRRETVRADRRHLRALAPTKQIYRPTEWNRFRIELKGMHLKVTLNGELIQDVDLSQLDQPTKRHDGTAAPPVKDRPKKGHIGFQHLSQRNEPVLIRGARIKEL